MTLQQILYALTIARTGSMNKAAEKLYISQPTLTSAMQELEAETGISIFTRTNRGVTITKEGTEFLSQARQLYQQYEMLQDKYSDKEKRKGHFSVSTQHYSFADKAFVETVRKFGYDSYELAIKETKTINVIHDVQEARSDVGLLYLSDFNRRYLKRLFRQAEVEFHPLTTVHAYVYLYKNHPLAHQESISFEDLKNYPCLSFDQGKEGSAYLSEEILPDDQYDRLIKTNDRATMLNLMVGLNGYTLCSGFICEELNGSDYIAIPFQDDDAHRNSQMEIGYIVRRSEVLSPIAESYIEELKSYIEKNMVIKKSLNRS